MAVRQFCEHRTRSAAAAADRVTRHHQVADYLAGYAEALADATTERHGGVTDD
ncbi:hypothetical protein [Mycolicibacterium neworleansense]|uniref:Uncharacterized protein n=1 Tax=Mycolicibacterium neworleansense TaxID=146018 RepID=A0A0H5S0Q5_9MYCO|nr:hypothetical protein [Mycolicibacterium neworleansense]MCV7360434.1 hypothetical protein [Mycolicibacterium neworleansense]CRZ14604.1 hypothetical protein BN2156_01454 [Mycolicibacterium neworleansense]